MKYCMSRLLLRGSAGLLGLCFLTFTCAEEPERSPKAVIQELLQVYGKKLETVEYIPALGVYGRLQYGSLIKDPAYEAQVFLILDESRPTRQTTAGHLIFAGVAHLPESDRQKSALASVREAADRLFDPANPHQILLPSREEMSDAVFMIGPILCETGALTSDAKYHQGALRYLEEMRHLRLREDGLYRHGHLCDAAWGRGNGFPAVGTSWCLTRLPKEIAGRDELFKQYQRHMESLRKHQTPEGFWRQVIDAPEAYQEFSATAMIGFAMQRGLREGWLDSKIFQSPTDRAWRAMCAHLEPGGRVIDVCEGTGTQKSLEDYLRRKAIRGIDARAGAMALLFANERLAAELDP